MNIIVSGDPIQQAARPTADMYGAQFAPQIAGDGMDFHPTNAALEAVLADASGVGIPRGYRGYGLFNREDWALEAIRRSGREHTRAVGTICSQLRGLHRLRPEMKTFMYGFTADVACPMACGAALPLLGHLHGLAPNLYPVDPHTVPAGEVEKIQTVIRQALELAAWGGGVWPVINDRVHNSVPDTGMMEVDDLVVREYVRQILAVEVDGRRINGIICWGADLYFRTFAVWDEATLNLYSGADRANYAHLIMLSRRAHPNWRELYLHADGSRNNEALRRDTATRQARTIRLVAEALGIQPTATTDRPATPELRPGALKPSDQAETRKPTERQPDSEGREPATGPRQPRR